MRERVSSKKQRVLEVRAAWRRVARSTLFLLLPVAFLLFTSAAALAQSWGQGPPPRKAPIPAGEKPRDLEDVRIDQRLDESLPLDAVFRDENGAEVKLGSYFGRKPVVMRST